MGQKEPFGARSKQGRLLLLNCFKHNGNIRVFTHEMELYHNKILALEAWFLQIRYAADVAKTDKVYFDGDETASSLDIGQIIGGIDDIPSCQELIERIVAEAKEVLEAKREKGICLMVTAEEIIEGIISEAKLIMQRLNNIGIGG